ncbi:hypothetical protein HanRHA438_Chr04g0163141 [Helianthus annuus]|nr:hypothetical protein HanRHA438_Chr04g0163141 [Helianthus annuus]
MEVEHGGTADDGVSFTFTVSFLLVGDLATCQKTKVYKLSDYVLIREYVIT